MHTLTTSQREGGKAVDQPARCARCSATAPPSGTQNDPSEQHEVAPRGTRGAGYSFTTKRYELLSELFGEGKTKRLQRTISQFLPDSVGNRSGSDPPQQTTRIPEHDRKSFKALQNQFHGSGEFTARESSLHDS